MSFRATPPIALKRFYKSFHNHNVNSNNTTTNDNAAGGIQSESVEMRNHSFQCQSASAPTVSILKVNQDSKPNTTRTALNQSVLKKLDGSGCSSTKSSSSKAFNKSTSSSIGSVMTRSGPRGTMLQQGADYVISFEDKQLTTLSRHLQPSTKNARMLYISGNYLSDLSEVSDHFRCLTHLYCNDNELITLHHLNKNSESLVKLNASSNKLESLDGLEHCYSLEELRVQNQNPQNNHSSQQQPFPLQFPPQVMYTLSQNLRILDVSGCHLTDLSALAQLPRLEQCFAANNQISVKHGDREDLLDKFGDFAGSCKAIEKLDISGNPCATSRFVKDFLVAHLSRLEEYNEKRVNSNQRDYLIGKHYSKSQEYQQQQQQDQNHPDQQRKRTQLKNIAAVQQDLLGLQCNKIL